MRVLHRSGGDDHVLATEVDLADSFLAQTKGLMGASSLPDGYALVFQFGESGWIHRKMDWTPRRFIHMVFVRTPLDVLWIDDDEVRAVKSLRPWFGVGVAKADTIVELPAGAADGVEVGDTVVVEDGDDGDSTGDGEDEPGAENGPE